MPNTGFQTKIATVGVVSGGVGGYLYGRIFIQLNIAIDGGPPYCFWELRVEYFTQHDDEGNCGVEGLGFPPYRHTIWLGVKYGGDTPLGVYTRAFPSGCFSGGDGYASSLSSVTVV